KFDVDPARLAHEASERRRQLALLRLERVLLQSHGSHYPHDHMVVSFLDYLELSDPALVVEMPREVTAVDPVSRGCVEDVGNATNDLLEPRPGAGPDWRTHGACVAYPEADEGHGVDDEVGHHQFTCSAVRNHGAV